MSLRYCACHEKVMPGHTKCCTCHAKSSQQTWRSDAPKCNPSQEIVFETATNPRVLLTFDKVHNPLRVPRKTTSERPKVLRTRKFFTLLTSKCASRHNVVHFFDMSTSKNGPRPWVFNTFDFEMCFTPQRRALFQHLHFQKWSQNCVLCTCWLGNVLRATTACNFSTCQLPKVVRTWCVLYILTWKCASGHNGVQFFLSLVRSTKLQFIFATFRKAFGGSIAIPWHGFATKMDHDGFSYSKNRVYLYKFPSNYRFCILLHGSSPTLVWPHDHLKRTSQNRQKNSRNSVLHIGGEATSRAARQQDAVLSRLGTAGWLQSRPKWQSLGKYE